MVNYNEVLEYINQNVGFDCRKNTSVRNLSAVNTAGYFYKTLKSDFYYFQGERFGSLPKEFVFTENFVRKTSLLNKYKSILHEIEMLACSPTDLEKDLREYIQQQNYVNELRDENLYFVIWYGWEGDSFTSTMHEGKNSFASSINRIIDDFEIPRHKLIFLVSNLIGEKSLKESNHSHIEFWGDNWFEIDALERDEPQFKRKLSYSFDEHFSELKSNYEKPCLRANRTWNEDRDFLLYDIFKRNIEDKFIYEHRQFKASVDMCKAEIGGDAEQIIERINNKIPLVASKSESGGFDHNLSNEIIPQDIYVRSAFSFISTTFPYNSEIVFFHGSTFEPIMNFHPFILNSNYNFLSHLKDTGYVTFDDIFDESYDLIGDVIKRRISAVDSVEKIVSLSKEEILNLIFKSRDKIVHNRNKLIECKSIVRGHTRLAKHLFENE